MVVVLLQEPYICSRKRNRLENRNVAAKLLPWKGGGGTQNAMTKNIKT